MRRLAIITTHPIQYYAPIFKLLHQRGKISIKVFYTWGESSLSKHDPGFAKNVNWDIPLLDKYDYEWVNNTSLNPGSNRFRGIINPNLPQQITQWQPDAVLFFGWAYDGHLNAIKKLAGKFPLYFRGDSTLLNEPKGVKRILKYVFLRWVYKHFKGAFFVGFNNKKYFKKYGFTDNQLAFTPHAIDNERFGIFNTSEVVKFRSTLNLKNDDVLVLYAGKFEAVKNLSLLLKAFIALNQPAVHLLLVGNGVDEDGLKKMAAKSSLCKNIHFSDFKNQTYIPTLYHAADLVCLPSKSETWGLTINEAMACSKAVLVSDKVGCGADLVKENYNGGIFKSENEYDLLNQLAILTKSKTLLKKYGENSAKIIKEWNFLKIAEAIENKILNEKNRPYKT